MILPYIINIISGCILAICTYNIAKLRSTREDAISRDKAIEEGVQCLLRQSIVTNYNRYSKKGYCPIYAKESLKRTYAAYNALGGNDVATQLYHRLLDLPEEGVEDAEQ